jgi:putative PIG3 family NAD(P)H quinone oxidoreductase
VGGVHAVTIERPGGPDVLTWSDVPDPECGPGQVLIDVAASAVNRADVSQRQGHYPPPPGAPEYPGLECSGRIAAVGAGVTGWSVGDEVCALLGGGGYAERVVVDAGSVLPVPAGVPLVDAAGLPEVAGTVWSNVFQIARLAPGEALLVHGGASGIGTFAVQLARAWGAVPYATARAAKHAALRELGVERAIDYTTEDFVAVVEEATGGRGVDVVLDIMGASYLERNLKSLAPNGRLAIIGFQGGATTELNLGWLMTRRASVSVTGLRYRPAAEKAAILTEVRERVWPLVAAGKVRPVIDRRIPMADAAQAHRALESGDHVGKILLVNG